MNKGVDYIGVSIVFFCHDGKGNFVMAKRSKLARDEEGRWDIGGGALEFGDDVVKTLKREIKEEYGTDVLEHDFLGFRDVHRVHQGKKTHWIALCFKVLVDRKKVRNAEPHKFDGIEWFRLDSMPPDDETHSQWPAFLKQYESKLKS